MLCCLVIFSLQHHVPNKEEISQAEEPISIFLKKKYTDWKQNVWWKAEYQTDKISLPVTFYSDGSDTLNSGQTCLLRQPRIHLQMTGSLPRLSVYSTSENVIKCYGKKSFYLQNILENIREVIRSILLKDSNIGAGFIACGLFLGEKKMIPVPLKNKINRAGISHLFAVSGLHVGFIVMLTSFILKKAGCRPRLILWIIPILSIFYAFLTPFSSSIFRTVLMVTLYSTVTILKRKIHIFQIVFLSMLIMLMCDPLLLNQVGFWFSYLAVLGILIFYPPMEVKTRNFHPIVRYVLQMLYVSIAATWGIMPAGVIVFGTFSTLAIVLNLVMIPLVFLMLASIIAKLFLHALPLLGTACAYVYSFLSDLFFHILFIVTQCDNMLVRQVRNVPLVLSLWFIITLLFFDIPGKKVHKYWLYSTLLLVTGFFPGILYQSVIIPGEDNALILRKGKKVFMMNGAGQDQFEQQILKRFRLTGVGVEYFLVTHPIFINPENVLRLKKKYPDLVVMAPDDFFGLADVIVRKDTSLTYGSTSISLFPNHNKINALLKLDGKTCGLLEYAEKMDGVDLVISRKKYSELRTGTDKFLTVRQLQERQNIKAELKKMGMEAYLKIW